MISVVLPAFNEASALARLLPALPATLDGRAVRPLVVNDGSTDGTPEVARAHGVQVVDLWPNRGKGAALRAGLVAVRSEGPECVVLMDADGQHEPRDLPTVVAPVLAGACDVACGSRYISDRRRGPTPRNRLLIRSVAIRLLRSRLGVTVTDPFSGYRCLAPHVARSWTPRGDRYEAELELLFDAVRSGWRLREVPVARIYTSQCSKMGARGPLVGRVRVLQQYAATIVRKSAELADDATARDRAPTRQKE